MSYPQRDFHDPGLQRIADRLILTLTRDRLVQDTLNRLRSHLQVDRVVLYYFYRPWQGQVTAESLADPSLSILGSTGADDCFNGDYAARYLAGRTRAIADVSQAGLDPCHLEFLQQIHVRANLVVPVLVHQRLWGLLIAHHCQSSHHWAPTDLDAVQAAADQLSQSPALQSV